MASDEKRVEKAEERKRRRRFNAEGRRGTEGTEKRNAGRRRKAAPTNARGTQEGGASPAPTSEIGFGQIRRLKEWDDGISDAV